MVKTNRTRARRRAAAAQGTGAVSVESTSSFQMQSLEERRLFAALPQSFVDLSFTPGQLVADRTRNAFYLTDVSNDRVLSIDDNSGTVTPTVQTLSAAPAGIAVSTTGDRLFVAEPAAKRILVYSLPTLALTNTLVVNVTPNNIAYAGTDKLFVTDAATGNANVVELNALTGATIGTIGSGNAPQLVSSANGNHLYIRDTGLTSGGEVDEFDATQATAAPLLAAFPENENNGIDFSVSETHGEIYRVDLNNTGVDVLNTGSGGITRTLPITGSPVGVAALDAGTSVFGGSLTGEVDEFSQATGAVLNKYVTPGQTPLNFQIVPQSLKIDSAGDVAYLGKAGTHYRLYLIGNSNVSVPGNTGNQVTSIQGYVYSDRNADGVRTKREGGLSGFTVFIDDNANGVLDVNEDSAITDASGHYIITANNSFGGGGLFSFGNTFIVRVAPKAGFRATTGLRRPQTVNVDAGIGVTADGPSFGETQLTQIAGVVFRDANGNANQDATEGGLAGFTVFLDLNNDGVFDSGDVATTTDRYGRYLFTVRAPGTYTIGVVRPRHYRFTTTASGEVMAGVAQAGLAIADSIGLAR